MNFLAEVGISMLARIPYLLAWLVGVILAVKMVRRGGKAEVVLLVGCSLMLFAQLVDPFLGVLARWMMQEQGMQIATIGWVYSLPFGILNGAGIICLICAFWIKFRVGLVF